MKSMMYVIHFVPLLLSRLGDYRIGELNQTEKVIITPGFEKGAGYAKKLSEAADQLQIHKSIQKDEK